MSLASMPCGDWDKGCDVRALYHSAFPRWSQPFWTLLTGKPMAGERPLWTPSGYGYFFMSLAVFAAGVLISMGLVCESSYAALILSLPVAVLGSRLLVLTVAHQCAHNMLCDNNAANRLAHDVITTLTLTQDYQGYRHDHFVMHHGVRSFGTYDDPVLDFIVRCGFEPGMSKGALWHRLAWTCVSPAFHGRYLRRRLKANFVDAPPHRAAMATVWWGGLAVACLMEPTFATALLISYVLPLTVPYHICAFLELICEHVWVRPIGAVHGRKRIAGLSWGRFCGEAPPRNGRFFSWLGWTARHLFYHLPCRALVLTGDAPQHDFHHVAPSNKRWTVSTFERARLEEEGKLRSGEVWGLFEAIDFVFVQLSSFESEGPGLTYLRPVPTA